MARINKAELPEKLFTEEDIAELKVILSAMEAFYRNHLEGMHKSSWSNNRLTGS